LKKHGSRALSNIEVCVKPMHKEWAKK